ncbi:hypothetical protein ACOJBO_10830 [Rhizobium beringeri]
MIADLGWHKTFNAARSDLVAEYLLMENFVGVVGNLVCDLHFDEIENRVHLCTRCVRFGDVARGTQLAAKCVLRSLQAR